MGLFFITTIFSSFTHWQLSLPSPGRQGLFQFILPLRVYALGPSSTVCSGPGFYLLYPSPRRLYISKLLFIQFSACPQDGSSISVLSSLHALLLLLLFFLIEVWLIYNVVLISAVQQSESVIHIYTFFFIFFSIMVYPRTLNIVHCTTQQNLVVHLFYSLLVFDLSIPYSLFQPVCQCI